MLSELKIAIEDVFSNKIRWLFLISVLSAVVVLTVLFFGFSYAMSFFEPESMPKVQKVAEALGYIMFFIVSLMFFPSVITLFSGFFIDSAIERLSVRNNGQTLRKVPLSESLFVSGVVAVKGIVLSITLIPITMILGVIPFVNFLPVLLYYFLNGRLLGREYFFAVALRYAEKQKAEDLFNRYRLYWTKAGIVIAVLMTVPVVNTISPLIAAAFMQRLLLIKNPEWKTI